MPRITNALSRTHKCWQPFKYHPMLSDGIVQSVLKSHVQDPSMLRLLSALGLENTSIRIAWKMNSLQFSNTLIAWRHVNGWLDGVVVDRLIDFKYHHRSHRHHA